jgi:hypothetical protein
MFRLSRVDAEFPRSNRTVRRPGVSACQARPGRAEWSIPSWRRRGSLHRRPARWVDEIDLSLDFALATRRLERIKAEAGRDEYDGQAAARAMQAVISRRMTQKTHRRERGRLRACAGGSPPNKDGDTGEVLPLRRHALVHPRTHATHLRHVSPVTSRSRRLPGRGATGRPASVPIPAARGHRPGGHCRRTRISRRAALIPTHPSRP